MSRTAPAALTADERLTALFDPRGIAVVGASRGPGKLGAALARSLAPFAATGRRLALVNPRDDTMYRTVTDAAQDGPIDLVTICVPAAACAPVLAEAAGAGAGAAVICGGGFAEAGGPGVGYQHDLARIVAETGIRLLGPNTSGFLAPHRSLTASFVPGAGTVPAGSVAIVAASGGVNHALAFMLTEAGHGISLAVGLGNAVDVSAPDVLDHLAGNPATRAVALHVESVHDGPRLVDSVRRLARSRPVVALVVGRYDIGAFAASHTGALATSWQTTRAALAQAGAVLVSDERELVDAVGALAVTRARPTIDPGVGLVTAQAGPGLLLLDDLKGRRTRIPDLTAATQDRLAQLLPPLTFQRNPVDTGRPSEVLSEVLTAVSDDPGVDVIAAYALHEPDAVDLVAAASTGRRPEVPLVLGLGGVGAAVDHDRRALLAAGVAVASSPRGVAAAVAALTSDAHARAATASGIGTTRPAGPVVHGVTGAHDEDQAKHLLDQLGIRTPRRRACTDRAAAHAALAELGAPVAVKVLDGAILHKSEAGGVHLDIHSAADLDRALDRLDAIGAHRYLVESMAPSGIDLIAGARRDPVFGPIVLVGLGGTTAEAVADVAIRLAPIDPAHAAAMPCDLAAREALFGWRGGPALDTSELGRILAALGDLLTANPALDEIEVNPIRLTTDGLVALDAVVITRDVDDAQPDL
ncbi:acetate--CoA ligase family protein [Pseudofrankia sp. DC12]|uniref:acetate--CoA ligase family protein n=1 Tax=Pseudofrankia sp. DC12 TaxID=683315 RepID=UPI0005F841E2|nr:acetate--CoA ligase family protein [Pseudofrankia sp. DC12]